MDTERLRIFVDVVRRGSFTAVARDLDQTPSSISRSIASLEAELGIRLVHRTTRKLSLTEAGGAYFDRVAPIVDELDEARLVARDSGDEPSGVLRVTAPVSFSQRNLIPLLPAFAERYPKLSLELSVTDTMVDLIDGRFEVALRLGRVTDSSLVGHRLCAMRYVACASPEYLARRGTPKKPADLREHECLRFAAPGLAPIWRFRARGGKVEEVSVRGRLAISNGMAVARCAVAGMGVTLQPRWNVAEEIADGTLVPILESYDASVTEFDVSAWVLYPSRRYVPLKVRVFVDMLRKAFAGGTLSEQALRQRTRGDRRKR